MSYDVEKGKVKIIDSLIKRLNEHMPSLEAPLCARFAKLFLNTVSPEDLAEWHIDDLYGALVHFWEEMRTREPNETRIHIYNPEFERHGWQTTHTVVEIITKDMPFLVDSLRIALNQLHIISHLVIHMGDFCVVRNKDHTISDVLPRNAKLPSNISVEAPVLIEIDRQTDPNVLKNLEEHLRKAIHDNRIVVDDWGPMRKKVCALIDELDELPSQHKNDEIEETKAFLRWIEDNHFTFLGESDVVKDSKTNQWIPLPQSGLGLLREGQSMAGALDDIADLGPEALPLLDSPRPLIVFKTNMMATIHRHVYADYIGVKRYDKQGNVIGECRIIGLFTSAAYNTNPKHIPFLRHKVALVMKQSGFEPHSHAGKILLNILYTFPRDDLFQATDKELLHMVKGIYYMQERRRIRLFARQDIYRRFVSCLVYVPRNRFTTELRRAMQKVLSESFHSNDIHFNTYFSESVLARIHFTVRTDPNDHTEWDFHAIEQRLVEVGRTWEDSLQQIILEFFGEEDGNRLFAKYRHAFPLNYRDSFSPRVAVYDIRHVEALSSENPMVINFYRQMDEQPHRFRLKIYQNDATVSLSDVLPIIEKLGMRAISERPYELKLHNGAMTFINDFSLSVDSGLVFDLDESRERFQNAFQSIWEQEAENDGFNQLVLAAGLNWREVAILRAYAKYFRQAAFTFSQDYIERALNNNPTIAGNLFSLFDVRFNPELSDEIRKKRTETLLESLFTALEAVENLDEDKIIRQYIHVINATLRTNFYQKTENNQYKPYFSIKIRSTEVPKLPKPFPMVEIFVYSPHVEGIHLRGGKVARGGIRWSDRLEDFRTEILGLMKAQQVKNAVIVPSGAKGGFVSKRSFQNATREEILAEGIRCYQTLIRGLLDLTDNYIEGVLKHPENIVCHDGEDPYLVVAADKGTATFSDIANAISEEYLFWLGDAFASGGSTGYDHKKIGITARGAWESVKRHFYEMDFDISKKDFTVVGIGDMAGDVFGNGMLLSHHIKLIAAFNHAHIFIDPTPDPKVSFEERKRLFHLPRSSWSDYNNELISKGGGVFSRSLKAIPVSREMKQLFGIKQTTIEPNELIRHILMASFDLLWSAGIGTFVKAESETQADVGDRTNDAIRINGSELQCKVVGEGGNLGLTQLARIEYSLKGGLIYTDFIDNSGGVSCSDKEVNIKILLDGIVRAGDLTLKHRNQLLSEMTDEVANLVLQDNFAQTRAISLSASQGFRALELHARYIVELESSGKIDRTVEFIPDEKSLMENKLQGIGMTRPVIAVLLSYSKTVLKEEILKTNLPEDPSFKGLLESYFPTPLQARFSQEMESHPLKREIIATKLSNIIINEMSFTFVFRMREETGAPVSAILRAYMIARKVLNIDVIWKEIEALEAIIPATKQTELIMQYVRLLRRVTRWFLRSQRMQVDVAGSIALYTPGMIEFKKAIPDVFGPGHRTHYDDLLNYYLELGISKELSLELTMVRPLFSALDIIDVASVLNMSVRHAAEVYFAIGEFLNLAWVRSQIIAHPTDNNWESLSREALRDDLDWQQRKLTEGIISLHCKTRDHMACFQQWTEKHEALIVRWRAILAELKAAPTLTYTMYFVAIRELLDLTQTTLQVSQQENACDISESAKPAKPASGKKSKLKKA